MDRRNEDTALLALRGGLRGRFRRSFDRCSSVLTTVTQSSL